MPGNEKTAEQLWPPPAYYEQLERLREAVGQVVYLAEINDTAMNAGVKIADADRVLLAIVEFPQPDPYRQLCPHMLILDDGCGINLGRVARVSINQAFGPSEADTLYQNHEFMEQVLFAPRRLSRESIAHTSQMIFRQIFGDKAGQLLSEQGAPAKKLSKS